MAMSTAAKAAVSVSRKRRPRIRARGTAKSKIAGSGKGGAKSGAAAHALDLLRIARPRGSDSRALVRRGLPFTAVEELSQQLELSTQDLGDVLGIPRRTVARRRAASLLSAAESDRLYRVAHIVALAQQVLGDMAKARAWLRAANRALAGETPLALLDTDVGTRQVDDLLQRINYGIMS